MVAPEDPVGQDTRKMDDAIVQPPRRRSKGRLFFDVLALVTLVVFGLLCVAATVGTYMIPQIRAANDARETPRP